MTTTQDTKVEYRAEIGERDITVTVKRYADGVGYNGEQTWVTVEEYLYDPQIARSGFTKFLFDFHLTEDAANELDVIRSAVRRQRSILRDRVHSWNQYREWARMEKGGKRGYYTRCANEIMPRLLQAAENWKLAKAIWKAITKL